MHTHSTHIATVARTLREAVLASGALDGTTCHELIELYEAIAWTQGGRAFRDLSEESQALVYPPRDTRGAGPWVLTHRALGTEYVRRFATEALARAYATRVDAGFYDLTREG